MKLSIIIPVFNEEKTILQVLNKIEKLVIPSVTKEIIIVNDASIDKTEEKIKQFLKKGKKNFSFYSHKKNLGKGAAVITGIKNAKGDFAVIQDADLEYNPQDISRLVSKISNDKSVIYGSRLNRLPNFSKEESRPQFFLHFLGNRFLSFITSILYGQWITDMETCYKLFPLIVAKKLTLNSWGFEFEPEITAKLLKNRLRIVEIPIITTPRGYEEGKKLNTVKDGIKAVWSLLKYRFID